MTTRTALGIATSFPLSHETGPEAARRLNAESRKKREAQEAQGAARDKDIEEMGRTVKRFGPHGAARRAVPPRLHGPSTTGSSWPRPTAAAAPPSTPVPAIDVMEIYRQRNIGQDGRR